jgi:hypothetical protein
MLFPVSMRLPGVLWGGKGMAFWGWLICFRPLAAVQENGQGSKRASWFFDRR